LKGTVQFSMRWSRLVVFAALASNAVAQNVATKVTISKLSAPTYPRVALAARIAGAVELNVAVRPDGSVDWVTPIGGNPILQRAAIESAQKTQFNCRDCLERTPYQMTFKFELGEAASCKEMDALGGDLNALTQVSQSNEIISIYGRPFSICDPVATLSFVRVHSVKCLYSWRCGKRFVE